MRSVRFTTSVSSRHQMTHFGMSMDGMPPMVREQFETRLRTTLETARAEHPVDGALSVTLLDAATGRTMATVGP